MVLVLHIYFRECCSQLILMGDMGVWDGSVAGCALDGVEGPQWLEAWVCILEVPDITLLQ